MGPTEILEHISCFIGICPRQSLTEMPWSVLGSGHYWQEPHNLHTHFPFPGLYLSQWPGMTWTLSQRLLGAPELQLLCSPNRTCGPLQKGRLQKELGALPPQRFFFTQYNKRKSFNGLHTAASVT